MERKGRKDAAREVPAAPERSILRALEIVSLCPFAVGSLLWQPHGGGLSLTACVKAMFRLEHGRDVTLADQQEPVGDDRWYDDARSSLAAASDRIPFRPRVDVTLVGCAYAPHGRPVDALVATLTVGELVKAIGVVGDRRWVEGPDGLEPSAPAPFTRMPLRYERAQRGADNPVGLDLTAPPSAGALALPNLEPPDDTSQTGKTIGMGPVAASWRPRARLLGPDAARWVLHPEGPAPPDLDFAFFNAAPPDQQLDLFRSGSRIVLENLHPTFPRLETRVPAIRVKAFLLAASGRASEIALRCDTVAIDTERGTLCVCWRGLAAVDNRDQLGTLVVAVESRGKEIRYKQVEAMARQGTLTSLRVDDLAMDEENPLGTRHDDVKPGHGPPQLVPRMPATSRLLRSEPSSRTPLPPPPSPAAPAASPRAPAPREESTSTEVNTHRIAMTRRSGDDELADPTTATDAGTAMMPAREPGHLARLDSGADGGARSDRDATGGDTATSAPEGLPGGARASDAPQADATAGTDKPPATDQADDDAPSSPSAWRDVAGHDGPPPSTSRASRPDATDRGLSLERYASVRAQIDLGLLPVADVLALAAIATEDWAAGARKWADELERDEARRKTFDDIRSGHERALRAFVDLPAAEWARSAVLIEAGDLSRVARARDLDASGIAFVRGVWADRAARDAELAKVVAEAMDAARWE